MIERAKMFYLKLVDDEVVITDTAERLGPMFKDLEVFNKENGLVKNEHKAKVMIFRKGGKRRKERWWYMGKELEVVEEYKYLAYWLTTANT